jgi:hypothetical protein
VHIPLFPASLSRGLAIISHQISTPLTPVSRHSRLSVGFLEIYDEDIYSLLDKQVGVSKRSLLFDEGQAGLFT